MNVDTTIFIHSRMEFTQFIYLKSFVLFWQYNWQHFPKLWKIYGISVLNQVSFKIYVLYYITVKRILFVTGSAPFCTYIFFYVRYPKCPEIIRIQEEITNKDWFLRPYELNGRSLSVVNQSQNFLGSTLQM